MPDLLDFNPNRGLQFDPSRGLWFDPNRKLWFDPNDGLWFDPDRDLGFGKRGPVFRGYVCPVCGASVTADQPSCTECGAVFEAKPEPRIKERSSPPPGLPYPTTPPPPPPPQRHAPPPVRQYPPPPKRVDMTNCIFCGARIGVGDEFCWNCGNRIHPSGGR